VIKAEPGAAVADLRRTLAYFAAPAVADLLRPGGVLAVAGGRPLQEVAARRAPPEGRGPLTVVQAMGHIDSRVGPHDAVEIGRAIAQRWGGTFLMLNTPALLPDRPTRDRFLKLGSVRPVKEQLRRADVALVGVGTPHNSVFVERGALTAADVRLLTRRGAVGEVCGRFFDAAGRECDTPLRHRVVGID